MLKKVKPAEFYFVATLTYIVLYVMIHVGWIYGTTVPVSAAMNSHGYTSAVNSTGITRSIMKFEDFDIRNSASLFTTNFSGYPTSYYSIIAAIHCLVSKETSYLHMRLISMFLNIFLLLLTFRFAQKIFSPRDGFYSCLILSLYPQFYNNFNVATPHLFLTLLVFLSFYFLYRCDYFQKRAYSILFALTSGASLFVKQEALLFLALPSLFVAIRTIAKKDKRRICNLIIAAAFFLILFIPFFNNFIAPDIGIFEYRLTRVDDIYKFDRSLFEWESLTFYVRSLFKYQLHPFFAILFLLAIPFFLMGKKNVKGLLMLYTLSPIIILTFIPAKSTVYTMQIIPAMSIITAHGFFRFMKTKRDILMHGGLLGVCVFGLLQFHYFIQLNIMDDSNYARNLYVYENTITRIFRQFDINKDPLCVAIFDCSCADWLRSELGYRKLITKNHTINFLKSLTETRVINDLPGVDYFIYHNTRKDCDWPSVDDFKYWYGYTQQGPSFYHSLYRDDIVRIVEACRHFRKIAVIEDLLHNKPQYFFVWKNVGDGK